MNNYCIYHLHSDMSNGVTNIDSVTKFQKYVDRAKEIGMKAMAFSEHGSVFAWDLKKEAIEKAGMKYIHAEEFYITQTLEEKVRDNWHCVLIGKNWDGVRELNYLASKSFNRKDAIPIKSSNEAVISCLAINLLSFSFKIPVFNFL